MRHPSAGGGGSGGAGHWAPSCTAYSTPSPAVPLTPVPPARASLQSPPQRPPRFYVPAPLEAAGAGAVLRLPPDEARHATKTLRLREGDRLELCDGRGWVVQAELAGLDKAGAVVHAVAPPVQVRPRA